MVSSCQQDFGVAPEAVEGTRTMNLTLEAKLRDIEKLRSGDHRKAVLKFVDALLVRQKLAGGAR